MFDFVLDHLPERSQKPREKGVSMVMDKGLSITQASELVQVAGHLIDFIKLGFGTSYVSAGVKEKIEIYQKAGIEVYLGGTFFEAFLVRDAMDKYEALLEKYKLKTVEISDGSIELPSEEKCKWIRYFEQKKYKVFSEVGSKNDSIIIEPKKWIRLMSEELQAGAYKVIAEARESGNVGIYWSSGKAHKVLINRILSKVDKDKILWEAPQKSQQIYFIKLLGAEVNLGNIAPSDIIPCETLRLGLRGDTFFDFLPKEICKKYKP